MGNIKKRDAKYLQKGCNVNVSSTNSRLRGLKARHLIGQSVRAVIRYMCG